jgi:DNA-binding XRE family transcriptional regulator
MKVVVVTKEEFRAWREAFGLTQGDIATRFGVTRNTIQNWEYGATALPVILDDLCKVWGDRLKKEIAEVGPVTLCYTDAPMFIQPFGPRGKMAMLKQESYPSNAAAIARVRHLWGRPDFCSPFITEQGGGSLWNQVELGRVVDGSDEGAPTARNTIAKLAAYVTENKNAFARGPRSLTRAEADERARQIAAIGEKLAQLAAQAEQRFVAYGEFEALLEALHKFAFYPAERLVGAVAHAIQGEEVARSVQG